MMDEFVLLMACLLWTFAFINNVGLQRHISQKKLWLQSWMMIYNCALASSCWHQLLVGWDRDLFHIKTWITEK